MMFSKNGQISLRQLQALVIIDIFGIGVIALPRLTAENAGQNGWIAVAVATVIMSLYSVFLVRVGKSYEGMTFVEMMKKAFSAPIGILLSLGLGFRILLFTGLQLRIFCEVVRQTMLFKTPMEVTAIVLIITSAYICIKGHEIRGRMAEILIFIIFVPMVIVFALACTHTDFTNLLPISEIAPKGFLKAVITSIFAFQGIELILLAYPFIRKGGNTEKAYRNGVALLGILMTAVTLISIARFGPTESKLKLWPVLQIMDTIDFPGALIERQDIFIMMFWIFSSFAAINAGIFFSSLTFSRILGEKRSRKGIIYILSPIVLIISVLPKNISETYDLVEKTNLIFGIIYIFVIPLLLIAARRFKNEKS